MSANSSALLPTVSRSPQAYPFSWDINADAVFLTPVSEADYAKASFLDQRLFQGGQPRGEWVGGGELAAAAASLPERLGFIFHIGHVGSTLISRLIGADPRLLSIREPMPLRQIAQLKPDLDTPESHVSRETYESRLTLFLKLWSRTFRAGQTPVVKATSFAAECAPDLLARPSAPSALLMFSSAEVYVASILAGPNSRQEVLGLAQWRLKRLCRLLGASPWRLWEMGEGERIAMSWLCEMVALQQAVNGREEQVAWVDFDRFLAEPLPWLDLACRRFGVEMETGALERLIAGPLMRQYSKAPEHAYDARLRAEVLAAGRSENAAELSAAMSWLKRAAAESPMVRDALDFAG